MKSFILNSSVSRLNFYLRFLDEVFDFRTKNEENENENALSDVDGVSQMEKYTIWADGPRNNFHAPSDTHYDE